MERERVLEWWWGRGLESSLPGGDEGEGSEKVFVAGEGGCLRIGLSGGGRQRWDRLNDGPSWGERLMGEDVDEPELRVFRGGSILRATLAPWKGCRGGGNGNFEGEAETEFTSVAPIVGEHLSALDIRCSRLCWVLAS